MSGKMENICGGVIWCVNSPFTPYVSVTWYSDDDAGYKLSIRRYGGDTRPSFLVGRRWGNMDPVEQLPPDHPATAPLLAYYYLVAL